MREDMLRRFFEGQASAAELADDLKGALERSGNVTHHPIVDMAGRFEVLPQHLVKVCDAVLNGGVEIALLEAVGFCLVASEAFHWNGESREGGRVSEVAFHWSDHRINYPLTRANVEIWRHRLLGQEAELLPHDQGVRRRQ